MTLRTTEVPECACYECGYVADRASGDTVPVPGDVSICFSCGNIAIFDDEMRPRPPTDAGRGEVSADPEVQRYIRAVEIKNMS